MTAQIVSVSRRKYAVGLFWQPLGAARGALDIAKRIVKSAPQAKFRYYVQYRNQVGLGSGILKHRSGLPALAPEVMEAFGDAPSFAAVFRVNNGYWMLAVRNGVILSDQDRLFYDENEARAAFARLLELPDWSLIVAPEAWGIQGSQERNIDDVISGRVKSYLKSIDNTFNVLSKLAIFAAFAIGGMYFFEADINRLFAPKSTAVTMTEESMRLYREQLSAADINEETVLPSSDVAMPWENIPDAAELSKQCTRAIAFVMQPIYGWNIISAECRNGIIRANARRDYGTIEDLYTTVQSMMPGVAVKLSGANGAEAELSGTFPKIAGAPNAPESPIDEVERRVRSAFQQVNMQADISRGKELLVSPDGSVKKTAQHVLLRADSKIMPDEFIRFMEIPSVEIISIRWDGVKNQWSYEEKIYAE